MTIDTSAVLAILQDEPERPQFVSCIEEASRRLISTVSVLEAAMVLEGRRGEDAGLDLDLFLLRASVEIVPFDANQLQLARTAFRRFHPALASILETVRPTPWPSGPASPYSSRVPISPPQTSTVFSSRVSGRQSESALARLTKRRPARQ